MRVVMGVAAALPAEAHVLHDWRRAARDPTLVHESLCITVTGPGAPRARAGALALHARGAGTLVSFGFAAGLDRTLPAGALLLPSRVHACGGAVYDTDEATRTAIRAALPRDRAVAGGDLAETRDALRDARAKEALGVATGAIAADMESAALAEAARTAGMRFAVLRAIVDPAMRDIPDCAAHALDDEGRVQVGRLLAGLARRPSDLFRLVALGRDYAAARASLALAARALTAAARCAP
jgi:adenosylhomocysteine nucleosidase